MQAHRRSKKWLATNVFAFEVNVLENFIDFNDIKNPIKSRITPVHSKNNGNSKFLRTQNTAYLSLNYYSFTDTIWDMFGNKHKEGKFFSTETLQQNNRDWT